MCFLQGRSNRGFDLPSGEGHQRLCQPSSRLCSGREEPAHLRQARLVFHGVCTPKIDIQACTKHLSKQAATASGCKLTPPERKVQLVNCSRAWIMVKSFMWVSILLEGYCVKRRGRTEFVCLCSCSLNSLPHVLANAACWQESQHDAEDLCNCRCWEDNCN